MRKIFVLFLILIIFHTSHAQQFIPNGSFEDYSACPSDWMQLDSALFWINPNNNSFGTPDYYNQCATYYGLRVPYNDLGYQEAHSGVAYVGLFVYISTMSNAREYIEVPLKENLTENGCYHFEMYVNLVEYSKYSTDDIGVYFSDTLIADCNMWVLPFTPQILNASGNLPDTSNWTLVSGDYIANGNENYLIIGNFKDDTNTDISFVNSSGVYNYSYFLIDDVSLTSCATGINAINTSKQVLIIPNPTTGIFNIEAENLIEFEILNTKGQVIKKQAGESIIDLSSQYKGIYIVKVFTGNSLFIEKIMLK